MNKEKSRMENEKLRNWLENCESQDTYDFVEDTQGENPVKDYAEIENSYKKFLVYKYNGGNKPVWDVIGGERGVFSDIDDYDISDPDGVWKPRKDPSALLQEIYKKLWGDLVEKPFMKNTPDWIASDTMTSVQVRFTDAMKMIIDSETAPENADKKVIKKIRGIHEKCEEYLTQKAGKKKIQNWWTTNFSILVIAALDEAERDIFFEIIKDQYPAMDKLLDLCHTIGNYCPVPEGFNGARSGNFADHDYWDLTLMKIREWYLSFDKNFMKSMSLVQGDLLHNCESAVAMNCIYWLESFGRGNEGWHNFVDTLYMQDYVDIETYRVKPFWEGHDWENIGLPEDKGKINEALHEITRRIRKRSDTIVAALREKMK